MERVEFIDYDGEFPCLCMGHLIIKVDGKTRHLDDVLRSGGGILRDYETVFVDPWEVDLSDYPDLEPYKEEITAVVNENVDYGCCGGCI